MMSFITAFSVFTPFFFGFMGSVIWVVKLNMWTYVYMYIIYARTDLNSKESIVTVFIKAETWCCTKCDTHSRIKKVTCTFYTARHLTSLSVCCFSQIALYVVEKWLLQKCLRKTLTTSPDEVLVSLRKSCVTTDYDIMCIVSCVCG